MVREWQGESGRISASAGRAALRGAVVAATLLVGCATPDTAADDVIPVATDPPTESSAKPPDTTTTTLDEQQIKADVEAAYRAAMAAFDEAAADPVDPASPGIDEWYEGPARERLIGVFEGFAAGGQAVRYPKPSVASIEFVEISIESDSAEATVCMLDDAVLFDVNTGIAIDDDIAIFQETAELKRSNGVWKVWERTIIDGGESECAFDH